VHFIEDVRYALRQWRKSPTLIFTAVLTLALGIGVNTSIFTVFHQVLLRTMPVRKPGELVLLRAHSQFETGRLSVTGGDPEMYFAYPAYESLRDSHNVLEGLAVAAAASASIVSDNDADKVTMQLVSGNYFTLLGVQPELGRLLTPSDDLNHEGRAVAVLSDSYWHAHFAGDPSILNQQVQINGSVFTIVGVVRHSGLMDANPSAVFLPISMQQAVVPGKIDQLGDPLNRWLNLTRIRAAVGVGAAVVVLEPKGERTFPPQSDKPVMDQVGLTFGPELLLVRTGQPVEFRNNDDTLHNVNVKHEETREQAFNVAIPTGGAYEHTFPRDGFYRVGCDIHPAMAASIFSASTPYTAVAGSDGRFTFADVPAGAWTITVYTGGRRLQTELEVKGAVTEVTIE